MLRLMYRHGRSTWRGIANRIDHPVVVLLYHRVTSLESDPYFLSVTPDNFRAHMTYLNDNYPVQRFEQKWSDVTRPSVVVTFDDGYADNVREALPILEEVGVPATFFIATGTIGTEIEFWSDELELLILTQNDVPSRFVLKDREGERKWPTTTKAERVTLFREIHPLMKQIDFEQRGSWLLQLRNWAGADKLSRKSHRPLTVDELSTLAGSPLVTIGAHGVTHIPFSAISSARQKEELSVSKATLETWVEREVGVFAYPFGGRSDYTGESARLCKEAGFVKAAANYPGQAHAWTDPFQIPRQMVFNWQVDTFAEKMSKFWT